MKHSAALHNLCHSHQLLGLPISELARAMASIFAKSKTLDILITGPSSVGKTFFAELLSREIIDHYKDTVTIIRADNFLNMNLRGKTCFRSDLNAPLRPEDFNYSDLRKCHDILRNGERFTHDSYRRGKGWHDIVSLVPAEIIILEGLFLDSFYARKFLLCDVGIIIESDKLSIAAWRRTRDSNVLDESMRPVRNVYETEQEIERAHIAYCSYLRDIDHQQYLKVYVDYEHNIRSFSGYDTDK